MNWLLGDVLFGTEIGEGQLKKPPCMYMYPEIYNIKVISFVHSIGTKTALGERDH